MKTSTEKCYKKEMLWSKDVQKTVVKIFTWEVVEVTGDAALLKINSITSIFEEV